MAHAVPRTEPLSTRSLVLGIASFVVLPLAPVAAIAAIVIGGRAKKAIDLSGGATTGRSAAVVGQVLGIVNLILSAVGIVLFVVLVAAATHHTRYTSLKTGDCFNRVGRDSLSFDLDRVACSQPHDAEVTGRFEANPGRFPGAPGFRAQAELQCSALASQYVGAASGDGLRFIWVTPNSGSWNGGTRTVICGLQNADQSRHRGSVRG